MAASMAGEITFEQKVKAAAWGATFACVESSRMFQDHFGKDPPRQNNDTENRSLLETDNLADDLLRLDGRKSTNTDENRENVLLWMQKDIVQFYLMK